MSDRRQREGAFRAYMDARHSSWKSWDEWQVQTAREDFYAGWDARSMGGDR